MKRPQIRKLARALIDEYSEEPEGLFKDEDADEFDINEFINLAQQKVELDLLPFVPHLFRKTFLISTTAAKRTYTIVSDLSVTDFLAIEDIYRNTSGERPTPLHFVEHDQLWEFVKAGEVGSARVWSWEEVLKLAIDPTPDVSETDIFKAFYSFKVPDLKYDDADIVDEKIGDGDGATVVFAHTALKIPVKVSTIEIGYTISASPYKATDDGEGVITGTNCAGTIDYETGEISLTFAVAPDDVTEIILNATATNKHVISALPEVAHVLIAIDTAIQCHLVGEEESNDLEKRYAEKFKFIIKSIASLPGAYSTPRPAARERIE